MNITTCSGSICGLICTSVSFDSISIRMLIDIAALSNSSRHQVPNIGNVPLQDHLSLAQGIMSYQRLLRLLFCYLQLTNPDEVTFYCHGGVRVGYRIQEDPGMQELVRINEQ